MTSVTSAHDGLSKGDLDFVFDDKDFASRVQEVMLRSADCEDGAKFDRENPPPSRKRQNKLQRPSLGRAMCAVQGVVINMGGMLSDLARTLIDGQIAGWTFQDDRQAAAWEATQRILEENPELFAQGEMDLTTGEIGQSLFALALQVTGGAFTLGPHNKIPSSMTKEDKTRDKPTMTTSTTSSTSGCPDPTDTPVRQPRLFTEPR